MYKFVCTLVKAFIMLIFRVKLNGSENVPTEGGFVLCSNHLSNWDPPLLQAFLKRRIYYLAKEELFHVFGLSLVLKMIKAIPVKRSTADFASIKTSIKTVKGGGVIGIFPTGQREMVKGEGDVKSGIGFLAVKTEAPVLPVHITASYRIFSKVTIDIGEPLYYNNFETKPTQEDFERISNEIYDKIKALGDKNQNL